MLTPDHDRHPAGAAQPAGGGRGPGVVEPHPVDDRPLRHQPEQPGPGVARLGVRGDGADLDVAEAQRGDRPRRRRRPCRTRRPGRAGRGSARRRRCTRSTGSCGASTRCSSRLSRGSLASSARALTVRWCTVSASRRRRTCVNRRRYITGQATNPASCATIAAWTRLRTSEPGEDGAHVRLHGAFHDVQPPGDLRVGQSGADQGQHLPLAVGEALDRSRAAAPRASRPPRELGDDALGDLGRQVGGAVGDRVHAGDELARVAGLEQEPARPHVERLGDVVVLAEGGQHDHGRLRRGPARSRRRPRGRRAGASGCPAAPRRAGG